MTEEASAVEPHAASRAARRASNLSRADAADFADAFDLDGAFGAPRRRFARDAQPGETAETHVIVLGRTEPEYDAVELPSEEERADRRTVRITGHPNQAVAPRRLYEIEARRPRRGVAERAAHHPDRIALYAVLLGLLLVVIAAASSSGA